jgi:glycosyltransferase involved in cell wall biosynthesis
MPTGWRHFLRAEGNNLVLRLIRNRFADHIVYQSEFVRSWWEGAFGEARVEAKVIHNGVPLNQYMPIGDADRPVDKDRLLVVEAGLRGGYEVGLETAFQLANRLISDHKRRIELVIAGAVDEAVKERWSASAEFPVIWKGLIPPDAIPSLDRSAHLLIAADLNPACPNAVIEGIACGLPVVAFETGSLPEIVTDEAGRLAAYGADPWQLERPDYASLADAAVEVLDDQVRFREGARRRALKAFGADRMVANYVGVFMKVAPAFGMV